MDALPTELLLDIAAFADKDSLYSLLLVNRRLNFAASRIAWHSLNVFSSRSLESILATLQQPPETAMHRYASFVHRIRLTLHRQASGIRLRENIVRLFHHLSTSPIVRVDFGTSFLAPSPLKPMIDKETMYTILATEAMAHVKELYCCDLDCFHEGISAFAWLASRCTQLQVARFHPSAMKLFARVRHYFPQLAQ